MLELITDKDERLDVHRRLMETVKLASDRVEVLSLTHAGRSGGDDPSFIFEEQQIWFHSWIDEEEDRFWNCLGTLTNQGFRSHTVDLEINPPLSGYRPGCQGVFGRCTFSGRIFLAHRGGLGGKASVKGSTPKALFRHAGLAPVDVKHQGKLVGHAVAVTSVDDREHIGENLSRYYRRVMDYKDLIARMRDGDKGAEAHLMRLNEG